MASQDSTHHHATTTIGTAVAIGRTERLITRAQTSRSFVARTAVVATYPSPVPAATPAVPNGPTSARLHRAPRHRPTPLETATAPSRPLASMRVDSSVVATMSHPTSAKVVVVSSADGGSSPIHRVNVRPPMTAIPPRTTTDVANVISTVTEAIRLARRPAPTSRSPVRSAAAGASDAATPIAVSIAASWNTAVCSAPSRDVTINLSTCRSRVRWSPPTSSTLVVMSIAVADRSPTRAGSQIRLVSDSARLHSSAPVSATAEPIAEPTRNE